MKFQTQQEQDLLKRLTSSTDFKEYLKKLVEDYEKSVESLLMGPASEAEVRRGQARELYLRLKELGLIQ